jgi:hypothetical protein
MNISRTLRRKLAALLALVFVSWGACAQSTMRLDSAEGAGAAECFAQILKAPPPEFRPRAGLVSGVDNWDSSENSSALARLTFTAADAPPAVEILYSAGNPKVRVLVEQVVSAYRLSCLPAGKNKIVATQRFIMRGVNAQWPRLKQELSLIETLRLVKDVKSYKLKFDFNTMACPFKLEFAPYRPFATNTVAELDSKNAARADFVRWLQEVTLDLPPRFMRTAIGEMSVVMVPCTVLDLS